MNTEHQITNATAMLTDKFRQRIEELRAMSNEEIALLAAKQDAARIADEIDGVFDALEGKTSKQTDEEVAIDHWLHSLQGEQAAIPATTEIAVCAPSEVAPIAPPKGSDPETMKAYRLAMDAYLERTITQKESAFGVETSMTDIGWTLAMVEAKARIAAEESEPNQPEITVVIEAEERKSELGAEIDVDLYDMDGPFGLLSADTDYADTDRPSSIPMPSFETPRRHVGLMTNIVCRTFYPLQSLAAQDAAE